MNTAFKKLGSIVSYICLVFWSLLILGVLAWIFYSSLKTNVEVFQNPWGLPAKPSFENYIFAWKKSKMGVYFMNSVIVSVTAIAFGVLFSSMASYALSRFNFLFKNKILSAFIFGMSIPVQLILIPLYAQLNNLNLVSTRVGIILVYITTWLPFSIYVLTGFFKTLPHEIEESALIDGCGEYRLFFQIMFPLVRPGLLAVATFSFVGIWNEYLLALCFTSSNQSIKTISLGMLGLKDALTYTSQWAVLFAAIIIMIIPALVVFFTLRKYVVAGLTLGAVKG